MKPQTGVKKPSPRAATRKADLAKIHIAKTQLGMDDETYRAVLIRIGNKSSAADLSAAEMEKVLEHMKRSGFKARSKKSDRPQADDGQSKMIRGLWIELSSMGVVRNSSESALGAFVKRMTKVDALQWLSSVQASQVIEHLKEWRERAVQARRQRLLAALRLPVMRLAAAEDDVLREAVNVAIGRKVGVDEVSETEFQMVLQHFASEVV